MAANSWMQHPVGYEIDPVTNRPVLNDIGAVFTNPVFVWGYLHVVLASLVTGSLIMLGISAWHLRRHGAESPFFRTAKAALVVLVPAILLNLIVGQQARHHRDELPTDEDRRCGGAMEHVPAVLVLGVSDRRRPVRRDPEEDHRDPAPAVGARDGHVERRGAGPQPPERAVPAAVRSGPVHPERLHPVLVDPRDGLLGRAHLPARPLGRVAPASRQARRRRSGSCSPRHGRSSPPS